MPLSDAQVTAAYTSLQARAKAAIDSLESKKSVLGELFSNNDTIEQSQGALRMTLSQLDRWAANGHDLASQGNNADPAKIQGWVDLGQTFATSIGQIDGYGNDATLSSVVAQTVSQSATDLTEKVLPNLALGFGGIAAIAIGAAIIYIVVVHKAATL